MGRKLTKREAVEFLELDAKTFENYFKSADEFSCLPRRKGEFYYFDEDELRKWLDDYKYRTVELTRSDYLLCLDFALAMHFRGYVLSDWGTARQREFGQKVTNWVKGQLAEVAVQKFLKKEFEVDVILDFDLHKEIVPQDIVGILENGAVRDPKIGVGIKSSKPKSAYLVLGENEVTLSGRRSDAYIFSRPDIPDDHLLRLTKGAVEEAVKNQPHYSGYKDQIPHFQNMRCEVAGWCWIDDLEKVASIPGQEFNGFRYVKKSGLLRRDKRDWKELLKKL